MLYTLVQGEDLDVRINQAPGSNVCVFIKCGGDERRGPRREDAERGGAPGRRSSTVQTGYRRRLARPWGSMTRRMGEQESSHGGGGFPDGLGS